MYGKNEILAKNRKVFGLLCQMWRACGCIAVKENVNATKVKKIRERGKPRFHLIVFNEWITTFMILAFTRDTELLGKSLCMEA